MVTRKGNKFYYFLRRVPIFVLSWTTIQISLSNVLDITSFLKYFFLGNGEKILFISCNYPTRGWTFVPPIYVFYHRLDLMLFY